MKYLALVRAPAPQKGKGKSEDVFVGLRDYTAELSAGAARQRSLARIK